MFSPATGSSYVHAWQDVYFPAGSYQVNLQPKWWNSTTSVDLQLVIMTSGVPSFLATYPPGPFFTVTYRLPSSGITPTTADTSKPGNSVTVVKNAPSTQKHLSGGKVAAAVIMPLLILFLISAAYIKIRRQRGREERKQWSEAIDKRMSTISTTWKPISTAGAQAAVRSSIAVDSNSRASAFSFGNIRPVSTVAAEDAQASTSSKARTVLPGQSNGTAQPRSSAISAQMMAERVSRVSFAPDVRPSLESRRTVSRAFHTAIVPPVPDRKWEISSTIPNSEPDETLSPTQTEGPETLSIEDIQARLTGTETASRPSVDAVMPALRCAYLSLSNPPHSLIKPLHPQ